MKQIRILGVLVMASFLLVSCATSRAYVEKDESVNFNRYHSYTWVDTKDGNDSVKTKISDLAERNIRQAVNTELAKAGWKQNDNRPDILLTYDVLVERSVQEFNDPVYSQPYNRLFWNPYTRRWNSIYYPSQLMGYRVEERELREGTITISMIDAKTNKTIWQGWTTEEVNSRNLTSKEIQASVKNIFRKFDLAKN